MKYSFYLLYLLFLSPASSWGQESLEAALCRQWIQRSSVRATFFGTLSSQLVYTYHPRSLFKVEWLGKTANHSLDLSRTHLNFVHSTESSTPNESKTTIKRLKRMKKSMRKQVSRMAKLLRPADSQKSCEEIARTHSSDVRNLFTLQMEIRIYQTAVQNQLNEVMVKKTTRYQPRFKEVSMNVIQEDLPTQLQDPETESVILVIHSTKDGILVDAHGKILPQDYFEQLSPIRPKSIGLFTCHAEAVAKHYRLQEISERNYLSFFYPVIRSQHRDLLKTSLPIRLFGPFMSKLVN